MPLVLAETGEAQIIFMLFNLLCASCFAAMGAIKREMNSARWTWFAIGYMRVRLCDRPDRVSAGAGLHRQHPDRRTDRRRHPDRRAAYLLFRPYHEAARLTETVAAKV